MTELRVRDPESRTQLAELFDSEHELCNAHTAHNITIKLQCVQP